MNNPDSINPVPLTRRECLKRMTLGAVAMTAPLIIPSRLLASKTAPSNRIRVGQIGCGRIARSHDIPGVFKAGGADFAAVCDVDINRAQDTRNLIQKHHTDAGQTPPDIASYSDYRELLARKDIDAVVISTPDHWHAEPAIAAVLAGKDVYLQKPMTMTHAESVLLRDAVKKSGCILQIGSQQRSWKQFRQACELVRSGRVGRITHIEIGLPIDPTAPDDPQQAIPSNLDYQRWLGPVGEVYYTEQRVHPKNGYGRPGWLRNEAFCLGMITGWGAHHFDTAHWGMDMEHTGPSRIEGRADFPANKIWNVHGAYNVRLTYPKNIQMTVADTFPNGIRFIGEEGWIFVSRDGQATASDPSSSTGQLKPLDASKPSLLDDKNLSMRFLVSDNHHGNWLDCVRSRKTPLAPADVGYYSNTACIVSWIAMKLGRPLNWDPKAGTFINDAEANAMLSRPERTPYGATNMLRNKQTTA